MVEAGVLDKKTVQHGAEQKDACAFKCLLVYCHRNLCAARRADAAALADTAYDRPAVDAAYAPDPSLGDTVGQFAEHRQHFPQSLGVAPATALNKAEMVGAKHVYETPGHSTCMRHFTAAAHLADHRLSGEGRADDAAQIERDIVNQAKIGAADTDGQLLGEMPVGA